MLRGRGPKQPLRREIEQGNCRGALAWTPSRIWRRFTSSQISGRPHVERALHRLIYHEMYTNSRNEVQKRVFVLALNRKMRLKSVHNDFQKSLWTNVQNSEGGREGGTCFRTPLTQTQQAVNELPMVQSSFATNRNACWLNRHFADEIQTRQYRSPEVCCRQLESLPVQGNRQPQSLDSLFTESSQTVVNILRFFSEFLNFYRNLQFQNNSFQNPWTFAKFWEDYVT